MKLFSRTIKTILILLILFFSFKYFVIYSDVCFSLNSRKALKGKIVYSTRGLYIKVIQLPGCQSKTVYKIPVEVNWDYGMVHSPYFSPDGSMIVYNQSSHPSNEKIYIMDSDGKNQKLFLDLGETGALCPSWSPDGKTIAYVVEKEGEQGLYTIRIADRLINRVSDMRPLGCQPSWSWDNKKITLTSNEEQRKYLGNNRYEVRDLGGTYIIDIASKRIQRYFDLVSEPAWSSQEGMFAYVDKNGFSIFNLESISKRTGIFIPNRNYPFFKMNRGTVPIRWSPDGKYVVFAQEIWPGIAGIYVVSIDNPKKKIRIGTDKLAIIGMSWAR